MALDMDSSTKAAQGCGHFMRSFDLHHHCPSCRFKGIGPDVCASNPEDDCFLCISMTEQERKFLQKYKESFQQNFGKSQTSNTEKSSTIARNPDIDDSLLDMEEGEMRDSVPATRRRQEDQSVKDILLTLSDRMAKMEDRQSKQEDFMFANTPRSGVRTYKSPEPVKRQSYEKRRRSPSPMDQDLHVPNTSTNTPSEDKTYKDTLDSMKEYLQLQVAEQPPVMPESIFGPSFTLNRPRTSYALPPIRELNVMWDYYERKATGNKTDDLFIQGEENAIPVDKNVDLQTPALQPGNFLPFRRHNLRWYEIYPRSVYHAAPRLQDSFKNICKSFTLPTSYTVPAKQFYQWETISRENSLAFNNITYFQRSVQGITQDVALEVRRLKESKNSTEMETSVKNIERLLALQEKINNSTAKALHDVYDSNLVLSINMQLARRDNILSQVHPQEWFSLQPEESHNQSSSADSVISDICTEDRSRAAAVYTELPSERTDYNDSGDDAELSDVSDVLSPDRKKSPLKFRVDPVGVSEGLSRHYRDRSVTGQEGVSSTSLYQTMDDLSLEEAALNLSHGALQAAILDLSQHEHDPSQTEPGLTGEAATSSTNADSNSTNQCSLFQHTFVDTSSFQSSSKPSSTYYSQELTNSTTVDSTGMDSRQSGDLTQYPVELTGTRQSGDLTQYPDESTGSELGGIRSSGESDNLFMARSGKDSRPATVIERPLTIGHNQMDSVSAASNTQHPIPVGQATHDYTHSSQFDHSVRFGHGQNPRDTLGDTLLYADKKPIISSTPHVDKTNHVAGGGGSTTATAASDSRSGRPGVITSESLGKTLEKLAGTQDSESETNTNITKFMKKAGVENYVTAEERQNIIDDLIGSKSSEISMDIDSIRRNESPVMRGTNLSPGGFHEMIPDIPSFRKDYDPSVKQSRLGSPGQKSVSSQKSGTSQSDSMGQPTLEQFTPEESSIARSDSSHSSERSSGGHLPADLGLNRERTSYNLFSKPQDSHAEQPAPAEPVHSTSQDQRSECSSLGSMPQQPQSATHHRRHSGSSSDARDEPPQYRSSDTLLGKQPQPATHHRRHPGSSSDARDEPPQYRSFDTLLGKQPQPVTHHRRHSGSSSDARDEPQQYRSSDTLLGYDFRDAASHASSESHPHTPRSVTSQKDQAPDTETRTVDVGKTTDKYEVEPGEDGMSDKSSTSQRSGQSYQSSAGSVVMASALPKYQQDSSVKSASVDEKEKLESLKGKVTRGKTEGREITKQKSPSKPSQIPRLSMPQGSKKDTSYKDEKWTSKVTGVLDSVAKRQSLSARVATILATAPPSSQQTGNTSSERSTPILKSSQGFDTSKATSGSVTPKPQESAASSTFDMITPRTDQEEFTPRTESDFTSRTDADLTPRNDDDDFMFAKEAQAVAELLQISKQATPSASSTDDDRRVSIFSEMSQINGHNKSATTSEDEDVERITGEYKSILKGVTEAVETGEDINVLRAKLTTEEEMFTRSEKKSSGKSLSQDAQDLFDYKDMHSKKAEDSVVSDASLDEDVKRILAKYGHKVQEEEQEVASSRQSPAGSAYETDDTLSHRVQKLLKKPTDPKKLQSLPAYLRDDPLRSLPLHSEVEKSDSLCPVGLGSLQQRIDDVKLSDERLTGRGSGSVRATQSVSDTLNERVRNMLADDEEEDATSKQVSSIGSRSQSRTSSLDYRNLEKDLDEIQSNLESLKGDVSTDRRSSDVSERSAELRKFIEHKGEDETLKKTRAVLEEQDLNVTQDDSPRFIDSGRRRLEPEGHGRSPPTHHANQLPLSPILTSGVIPMDVALDMIHGDPYSNYNGYRGGPSPGEQSSYSNRTIDTETLLKDAGYQEGYSEPASHNDSGQGAGAWALQGTEALVGLPPCKVESLTDREVREINGVGADTTLESFSKTTTEEQFSKSDPSDQHNTQIEDDLIDIPSDAHTMYKYNKKHGLTEAQGKSTENVSLDVSTGSPLTTKQFRAYGNMQNLLESHMNKFTASKFDHSMEMRSPLKGQMEDVNEGSRANYGDVNEGSRISYGDVNGERREDQYSAVSSQAGHGEHYRHTSSSPPPPPAVATERVSSPPSRRSSSSPRDGAHSRASSSNGSRSSFSNLRPYKPPGSREFYYVETGGDLLLDGMSETTVESTHPGSDDAVGPNLPPQAYGSRKELQNKGQLVMHSKEQQALGTIQEQSLIQEPTDGERHSQGSSSKPSRGSRSSVESPKVTAAVAASSSGRYREQSVNKAHDWVNGHWPSKEDLSETPKLSDNIGYRTTEQEIGQDERHHRKEVDYTSRYCSNDRADYYKDENLQDQRSIGDKGKSRRTPTDPEVSKREESGRRSKEWESVAVEPYSEYSKKCQNLQSRYKDIKARAEEAIDKLIKSESEESFQMDPYNRKTETSVSRDHEIKENTKKNEIEFVTPNKLGTSRLSLEMSLNDNSRLSSGGDSGRKSFSDTSRSSSAASVRDSSHEFMKYHTSNRSERIPEKPSNYRGPAYWNNVVQQNYSEMAKPKKPQESIGQAVSHDQEIRTIKKMEQERAARLAGGRVSPVGRGYHSPDIFQPLEPDQDDDLSPVKSRISDPPMVRSGSPHQRSPDRRSGSPYRRSGSPYGRSESPIGRSGSPHGRSSHDRAWSPSERLPHVTSSAKREENVQGLPCHHSDPPGLECLTQGRTRSPYERGDTSFYEQRSPENMYERSKSPYNDRRSPVRYPTEMRADYPGRGSPDVQDMWERFQMLQSEGSRPVNIDLDKLSSLLENPVQHMVKQMQHGTVFEQKGDRDRKAKDKPVRLNQSRTEVTEGDARKGETGGTKDSRNAKRGRGDSGAGQSQRSSEGHRRQGKDDDRGDDRRRKGDGEDEWRRTKGHVDVTDDSEETHPETEEEGGEVLEEQQKRKMAWVIKDEELHSIPENSTLDSISSDFTTSSEMDSDGKIVTKTTKRNLPGDPKLLRLQQKIAKQKEKYKRELSRERKRKEKISQLEALFKEKKASAKRSMMKEDKTGNSSVTTTTTCKTTSTPSSERHRPDDTTLGVSNITSTSTLTQGTIVSEDLTMVSSDISGTLEKTCQEEIIGSDNSSVCHCCHKRKPSSRSVSPPKHPAVKRNTHSHSASPARREKKTKERVTEPTELKLREVDYNKADVDRKTDRHSRKAVYMEIEKPQPNGVPKTKKKSSMSPSKRKEKENNENLKIRNYEDHDPRSSEQWSRSTTRRQREPKHSDMAVQMTPKTKTRDFGATCPTPLVQSPPVERDVRKVTMVSEAIQTERQTKTPQGLVKSNDRNHMNGRDHSPGMFTPEQSDSDLSMERKSRGRQHKRPVKAAQVGVSWFVTMKEPKPWRKPLRERQANAVAMETWPQMDEFTRHKLEEMTLGVERGMKSLEASGNKEKDDNNLQAAFEKKMEAFISGSRERQKHIALRAEERKISEIHRNERAMIFQVNKKKEANLNALPISDMHYQPRKRFMTKHEMRELTKKKYAKLPEVTQKQEDKKREETNKTNRLRAQMFKHKVQSKVLQKRSPSLHLP